MHCVGFKNKNPDSLSSACGKKTNYILVRKINHTVYLVAVGPTDNWTIELVLKMAS